MHLIGNLQIQPSHLVLFYQGRFAGQTSVSQRLKSVKCHTNDVKTVQNLDRSSDWLMQLLYSFSYCLLMTDRRKKVTQVTCDESTTKQSIFVEYNIAIWKKCSEFCCHLFARKTQNFTIIDHQYSISIIEVQMSLLQHIP